MRIYIYILFLARGSGTGTHPRADVYVGIYTYMCTNRDRNNAIIRVTDIRDRHKLVYAQNRDRHKTDYG